MTLLPMKAIDLLPNDLNLNYVTVGNLHSGWIIPVFEFSFVFHDFDPMDVVSLRANALGSKENSSSHKKRGPSFRLKRNPYSYLNVTLRCL